MYILKKEKHYLNGTTATHFYQKIVLGIMVEVTDKPEEAKQFRTKKEAREAARQTGSNWEVVKI